MAFHCIVHKLYLILHTFASSLLSCYNYILN
nr:MAG TPA: hypothetical protein [Caudoviricetes sp.]DAW73288.1 MAG TPA: hypothetical protein [Caudoviricetes sp.]